MKTYTKDELAAIIEAHAKWLRSDGGSRADLSGASLSRANLSGAYLSGANLSGANLSGADLSGANLSGADLSGAYLSRADLSGADLSGADLSRADLSGADLSRANLSRAYLSRAYLSRADLSGAYLSRAVHRWAQVAFMGHGECGRMLTAVIYAEGGDTVYQCGCFSGSIDELKAYIANGSGAYKPSRTMAMEVVTQLLNA